jgi:hypothetical protein
MNSQWVDTVTRRLLLMAVLMIPLISLGQNKVSHTISYDSIKGSPKATLQEVAWIQGHWRGTAFGGSTEEIWSPPLHGSMMGVFKASTEEGVSFYEIMTIIEAEGSLLFRLKHFDDKLRGWEKKDETVDFKLVKLEKGKVYFDDFTFEYISDDEINIYVIVDNNGKESEIKFNYVRFNPPTKN